MTVWGWNRGNGDCRLVIKLVCMSTVLYGWLHFGFWIPMKMNKHIISDTLYLTMQQGKVRRNGMDVVFNYYKVNR